MRKALITIAAALLLAGCQTGEERVHIFHVEHDGHTYVVAEAYGGRGVAPSYQMHFMHDPDCPCHHKENE